MQRSLKMLVLYTGSANSEVLVGSRVADAKQGLRKTLGTHHTTVLYRQGDEQSYGWVEQQSRELQGCC